MILAQLESISLLNLVVNGGAFALIVYIVVYGAPAYQKKASEDQKAEREVFLTTLAEERKEAVKDRDDFLKRLDDERKKSIAELTEKRREFLADQKDSRDSFTALARDMMKTYRDESLADRMACDKHFETLARSMAQGNEATMAAIKTMAEQMQSHMARGQQWEQQLREANLKRDQAEAELKQHKLS